jgi:hypothetical protein
VVALGGVFVAIALVMWLSELWPARLGAARHEAA